MKETIGNLWEYYYKGYPVCITTNGTVRANGELVMGAGCALEAKKIKPNLPLLLGKYVKEKGNFPYALYFDFLDFLSPGRIIVSFPVKENWYDGYARLELIEQSANILAEMVKKRKWEMVVIPRPGCGLGKLNWEREVRPLLEKIFLTDKFCIISKEKNENIKDF